MKIPVIDATPENVAPYGTLLGANVTPAMNIPFYPTRVFEGGDVGFRYRGKAVMRTAQVFPSPDPEVLWLERHLHLTQLFAAIAGGPYVMVMVPPNEDHPIFSHLPDLSQAQALRFPAHSVLLLDFGTWHDFPIAASPRAVTFLIANSEEVITTLQEAGEPMELDRGDVLKLNLASRFGTTLQPEL